MATTNKNFIVKNGLNANGSVTASSFVKSGGTSSQFLMADGSVTTSSGGTVTSVGLTVPTGLSISGSPITSSGTLAISLTAGYSIPTTANQTNWTTAYGWGNHASAGYSLGAIYRSSAAASPTYKNIYVSTADPSTYSNPAVTLSAGDLWIQV